MNTQKFKTKNVRNPKQNSSKGTRKFCRMSTKTHYQEMETVKVNMQQFIKLCFKINRFYS